MRNNTFNIDNPEKVINNHHNYRNVYFNLIDKVDEILKDISEIDIQHINVKKINEETQTEFQHLRTDFVQKLEKLDENAVWDRFTIAFFGETNAGKSTIIEALRISMLEDQKFKNFEAKKCFYLDIAELNNKLEEVVASITASKQNKIKELNSQLEKLKGRAKIIQNTFWANGLKILRSWFGLLPIFFFEKKISLLEEEISEVNSIDPEQNDKVVNLNAQINQIKKEREQLFDGKIIGTGVQDFTQSCIDYHFNQEEEPFTLIDVPGIEGNEGKYETMILDAVSKAHCVFYVCSAGKLPESGTIAKIKKYLNEQTEVYFLLNERKNTYSYEDVFTFESMHPRAEKFRKEISSQMEKELGVFYKGCYSLQGLMAFCSKGEIPEKERNFKFQKKLIAQFETFENLYAISQLEKVESLIRVQLKGMERKIIDANIQKAICTAIDFKNKIQKIRSTKYSDDFVQIIEKEIKAAKDKNDNNFKELENEFRQISNRFSRSTIEELRIKFYHLIDNKENNLQLNVSDAKKLQSHFYSNKEKKMKFVAECYSKYIINDFNKNYIEGSQKITKTFATQVKENINKLENNIQQIQSVRFSSFDNKNIGDFETLFSIQWGKLSGMLISVGGMAMTGSMLGSSIFPGPGTAIGAAIGAAVGFLFVGIRWLLNKETPESKAKKEIDKKLTLLKSEIKSKLDVSNKNIIDDCQMYIIGEARTMLDNNILGIKAIQSILKTKTNQLEILIEEMKINKN